MTRAITTHEPKNDPQEAPFMGYPSSQGLISTADPDFEEPAPAPLPKTPSAAKSPRKKARATRRPALQTLLVGLDLGTNTTCVQIAEPGATTVEATETIPTVVGYARPGILPGVLPDNQSTLFGQDALDHRLHLDLVRPLQDGIVSDLDAACDFLAHVKDRIGSSEDTEYRAVIGMPANADAQSRENTRLAATGIFDKVILIPEPFLAALGSRGGDSTVDPISNSIFVDIGAGSTDACLIQGYFPSSDDQISIAFAGDALDQIIQTALASAYPDARVSLHKCQEIKEGNAFVNGAEESVLAPVMVQGRVKRLEVANAIELACNALLDRIYEATRALIMRAEPDSIPELLQNVILTGGGSMIPGLCEALENRLTEDGFEGCTVNRVGDAYKTRVAAGALEAAQQADERQWQNLLR